MNILVVDDDQALVAFITILLEKSGYRVTRAGDGKSALQSIREQEPDLVLLDVALPHMNGFAVCREIRRFSDVPIIFLSARSSTHDRVAGLSSGGDDYLPKPFEPDELLARIVAVLRRVSLTRTDNLSSLSRGGLTLVPISHTVIARERTITLTPIEFRLLYYLMLNSGSVLSPQQILDRVWGYTDTGDHALVNTYIYRLRNKIEPDSASRRYIRTIYALGYMFPAEVEREPLGRLGDKMTI
jgi:two-component system, OmpR family, response regulator RegX3